MFPLHESTNETIPLSNIFLDSAFITTSDVSGSYTFTASKGKHNIKFTAFGFQDSVHNISVQKNTELNISLKIADQSIDQVVISASRMKQKISDVTVSMDVIRAELIENNNVTTLDKLIEQGSGVSIINGQANIRGGGGFSYGAGSRVLLLIDELNFWSEYVEICCEIR